MFGPEVRLMVCWVGSADAVVTEGFHVAVCMPIPVDELDEAPNTLQNTLQLETVDLNEQA